MLGGWTQQPVQLFDNTCRESPPSQPSESVEIAQLERHAGAQQQQQKPEHPLQQVGARLASNLIIVLNNQMFGSFPWFENVSHDEVLLDLSGAGITPDKAGYSRAPLWQS